jgi:hypothetical protein
VFCECIIIFVFFAFQPLTGSKRSVFVSLSRPDQEQPPQAFLQVQQSVSL